LIGLIKIKDSKEMGSYKNSKIMRKSIFGIIAISVLFGQFLSFAQVADTDKLMIYHDSFEDFVQGKFDASGQNIFVSRDGKIRTINRFDLNNDGWIDLVYPQTHDYKNMVPASLGTIAKNRELETSEIAVEGSLKAVQGDLNKDGWTDLIFCPNKDGIQHSRRFVTIFYGGNDGWPSSRSNGLLPVNDAMDIAIADINQDSWPDIVTLNSEAWIPGQPDGNILRIYWGNERGFLLTRYKDIGVKKAIGLLSDDFDKDSTDDLAVLSTEGTIRIIWGKKEEPKDFVPEITDISTGNKALTGIFKGDTDNDGNMDLILGNEDMSIVIIKGNEGRTWKNQEKIAGFRASDIDVFDLDEDGNNDIIFSYFSQQRGGGGELVGAGKDSENALFVLWGTKNGFDDLNPLKISSKFITSQAVGDYDGDGLNDIALAIHQGKKKFLTNSKILFGKGKRSFEKITEGILTQGAYDALTVQGKEGSQDQVVFSNVSGGTIDEKVPAFIYWGGEKGFDAENKMVIPFRSGYESTAADFNSDGFTDLIICNATHHSEKNDPFGGVNIFWGGAEGFDLDNRTVLREYYVASSSTADLNKDGYLDLVTGQYFNDVDDRDQTNVYIYYGSSNGYSTDQRVEIPCHIRSLSVQLADYDNDGWLDIAANSFGEVGVRIFYGSPNGFDEFRSTFIDSPSVADLETADLNSDGWLDIIACNYGDFEANIFDLGITIFWGGKDGFHQWNAQNLPGFAPLGPVVADWDNDGYLDLFTPSYHGNRTREKLPTYLFWGSSEGFNRNNKTVLINDSGASGFAADFNKDGLLDLAVANHTVDGNHNAFSKVYYNDGNHFSNPKIEKLPTFGPHWSSNSDMGHIANRSWKQNYESPIVEIKKKTSQASFSFGGDMPAGTNIIFAVRSAKEKAVLLNEKWIPVDNKAFSLDKKDEVMQYKIFLESDNGDRFPTIDWVKIEKD
jgi:hypothetical protein